MRIELRKRTRVQHLLSAFLVGLLAGCGGPKPEATSPPSTPAETKVPTTTPANGSLRAALALDTGGVDDKSFNAAAWAGLQRATKELGVEGKYVEAKVEADYKTNLSQFATQGYQIIFAVGYKMEDALKEIAPQFSNVKFAIVDGSAPDAPNCAAIQFKEEQATFLAGYLAASVSKTRKIGFVGGEQIPLIQKFEAGYRAGAKTANPAIEVLSSYTMDWNDIAKGKSQANQQFSNGADIVFQAAGKAGLGVIEAAREKGTGYYAIGVDQDQDDVAPGRVLTSVLKRLDNAVYDFCKKTKEGQFQPGLHLYDLKEGGVGLSEMKYTKKDVPPDVLARLDKLKQAIEDGKIVPPTTLEDAQKFQPPTLP